MAERIFPIKRGAKFPPLVKDWENVATDDPAQIAAWKERFPDCNWGIACGPSNLIVVDEDEPGSLLALELEGALNFPTTREVRTPRPGRHLYYIGYIRSSIKKYPGIDIKSAGGYVLAPGSKTSTGTYTLINDCDPVAPDPRLLECGAPEERERRIESPACALDSPSAVLRAKEYADFQAEPSIQGEGGDNNLFRVACRIRDLGVSQDTCLEILSGRWNSRCVPPWDFEDLEKKIGNAYRYARDQIGSASPEADFSKIPEGNSPTLEPFFDRELVGDPPERAWIVRDWLPQGEVTSLYGDGGQGKTLLAAQLAYAVSRGLPWLGLQTKQMPALCCMAEDDRGEVHRRVEAYRKHYGEDFGDVEGYLAFFAYPGESYTVLSYNGDRPKFGPLHARLCKWLQAMPDGPKLLILDTLADVFDGNENIRNQANAFVKRVLRRLCAEYAASVLLLAHPSRAGISGEDLLSGSTAWNNAVRNRLVLAAHKDIPDARWLIRVKSNYARAGERILLEYQAGVFVAREEPDMFGALVNGHAEHVLSMLRAAANEGRPFGDSRNHPRPLHKYLALFANGDGKAMRRETLDRIIDHLVGTGQVERVVGKPRGNGLFPL